ncbi:TerC family protein [Pseudomonas sp. NPDC087346]|uniref:TerC family protein n=1 Tax=Pseudomonas sp. NPDC087346 TaxID=3364438 RepID=UPI003808AC8C
MVELFSFPGFWFALAQIVVIDILLGGDNAIVIAMACRKLSSIQRNRAIIIGALGAIVLRVLLIVFALHLLELPFLKLVGALLLGWIAIKLLIGGDEQVSEGSSSTQNLWSAIRTIIVADVVMSMDNVVAVAGASKGNVTLVVIGVVISIPVIIWGSKAVLYLIEKYPLVITFGAALLGWIAGGMAVSDSSLPSLPGWSCYVGGMVGTTIVLAVGRLLGQSQKTANT